MATGPHILVILDGFGHNTHHAYNAIYHAHPQHFIQWSETYPSAILKSSGTHVGLLKGMIGNSEVGHLTIGSGRIIKQPVTLLTEAINNGSFYKNPLLINHFNRLKAAGKTLHLMGLLSDAGVHSLDYHLFALITMAVTQGLTDIIIHPFLDGRDVPPESATYYLTQLDEILKNIGTGIIGSIHGRFYAMDRDNHWERIKSSYDVLTAPQDIQFTTWKEVISYWYSNHITDEFIPPTQLNKNAYIQPHDGVIFFNFRADRARELTRALIDPSFTFFQRELLPLAWMVTGTLYSPDLPTDVLCSRESVSNTFFDVLEMNEKRIFTIAETEKYAHVTYFFNGGREIIRNLETRILIPSLRHGATYAATPYMSAPEITSTVIKSLEDDPHDFYLINYANADMVGHSGDFDATVKAIQYLDNELKKLYDVIIKKRNGTLYITSDHGKAEDMFDTHLQQPRTAHTSHPVPFLLIQQELEGHHYHLPITELQNIAPFILDRLNLPIPYAMLKR
jgi:2,3-bisphosphoglycerate-independent phosphoglycerate mutase